MTTDLLILLAGGLMLAFIALLLWGWRRTAVKSVIPTDKAGEPRLMQEPNGTRMPVVRGKLLWLLVQRGSQPPAPGSATPAPEVIAEAKTLLAQRRKIEAIKLVRQHTGWGLKESKDFVDELL